MTPPTVHAARTSAAEPTARAMSLVTRKMPVPMVSPMTIAVADHSPRPRIKFDGWGCAAKTGPFGDMEVHRAYYLRERWSIDAASFAASEPGTESSCPLCQHSV